MAKKPKLIASRAATATTARRRVGRPRRGAESVDTRQVILTAAEDVLIQFGYADFTTRKVAKAAGIAIGNLTYHFPNKANLTEALIAFILDRYVQRIRTSPISGSAPNSKDHPLGDLLRWSINDAVTPHIGRVCRELWAMACHQKFAARAMDGFYQKITKAAADVAQRAYPGMTDAQAAHLTYFMAILSEGAVVLFGTLPEAQTLLPGVVELAVRAIEHLAAPSVAAELSGGLPASRRVAATRADARRKSPTRTS
jgi:AcrR family transcriptional regulator